MDVQWVTRMAPTKNTFYIIDFDSTFIKNEGLDELARTALQSKKNKDKVLSEIQELTKMGMDGRLSFDKSLAMRLSLLQAKKTHVIETAKRLKKGISKSIRENKIFFLENASHIYIVSGGFRELIIPVVQSYGIQADHVVANTFQYDKNGYVIGCDLDNPLAHARGKAQAIRKLKLKGNVIVIGDGYTDYEVRKLGVATKFIAFSENVLRDIVVNKADYVAANFDEALYHLGIRASHSYPKNRIKVVLFENIDNLAVQKFEKEGYTVEYHKKSLADDELINTIKDAQIIGVRSKTILDIHILEQCRHLHVVGSFCIGTDKIDLPYAGNRGIAVFNAPFSNTRSVVELVMGEIIMLSRNIFEKTKMLHAGVWDKSVAEAHEIRGKKLGIVGYGNIGSQLSIMAESLGMEVYYYDIADKLALGNAKKCSSLRELLKIADVVTIHVDGRSENRGFIGRREFGWMKRGAYFINTSRGIVVDIESLVEALAMGNVRNVAIDVYPTEPGANGYPFSSPLQKQPNVILTPHIAGPTVESQRNTAEYVSTKVIEYMNTGNTSMCLSLPQIYLTPQGNTHRILHIHQNVPGVLAQINKQISIFGANIEGQHLKTKDDVGYLIMDVNKKHDEGLISKLRSIKETIKLRMLY